MKSDTCFIKNTGFLDSWKTLKNTRQNSLPPYFFRFLCWPLYSKEIVGYALNKRMTADLVCQALNNAIKYKRPARGLIVHSDRGIQYYSYQYRQIIEKHGLAGSMSRKGTQA